MRNHMINEADGRRLALSLLNSETGITEEAYLLLKEVILEPLGLDDIRGHVEATDGMFYLPRELNQEDDPFYYKHCE